MKLSQRMEAVAAMVCPGNILADVGTDHGYIPIALVRREQIPSAIAMDLREGPLERAKEHIASAGLKDRITTRLSDGVAALSPGEADTIVIAGMGGRLIVRILQQGEQVCKAAAELILQPQSEAASVRRFLRENGYRITQEDMVLEEGKFYPIIRAEHAAESGSRRKRSPAGGVAAETGFPSRQAGKPDAEEENEAPIPSGDRETLCDRYGPLLLAGRHPVLKQFLEKQKKQLDQVYAALENHPQPDKMASRKEEVRREAAYNEKALSFYRSHGRDI